MDCQTFGGVTPAVFACVKTTSAQQHGTNYDPPNANQGTATTHIPVVGTVVLTFDLDPTTGNIKYCIVSKPFIVTESEIFGGIASTINGCTGTS